VTIQPTETRALTNHALDRYNRTAEAAPISRDMFNAFFIGGLSVKFDYKLDAREWDDALSAAALFADRAAKERAL
jgi:hypothetical protein